MKYQYLVTLHMSSDLPPDEFWNDMLICTMDSEKYELDGMICCTRVHFTLKNHMKTWDKAFRVASKQHRKALKKLFE